MNKHFKKSIVFLLLLCTIISLATPSITADAAKMPYVIHETVESQYLGSGIKYENIKKFTSKGWWNINVVRVDLTDEYAEVKGLMNDKGLSNTTTVSNMVNQKKAVAGVNGDFFNFSPMPHPMGTFIEDGEVISSPIELAYALPTFYIDKDKKADITFFDRRMSLTNVNTGKNVLINLINKAADMKMVTLLNKHWGYKSFGNRYNKDTVELVVIDDIIKEIRIGQPPIDIPKDGYIITVSGDRKEPLLENFNVGDEVKLDIKTTPNLENIKFAIGGGSIILKDGKITNSNINIKGDHPRTGIGITEDGKELLIATIDGRHTLFKGVSQEIFAQILKDLGAYNAINLDGGGSTTMAVKPIDEQVAKVVNKPSDGAERRVPNGVGVFSNAPKGELSYIKVVTDDDKMFLNTSRRFSIKGYDQYHNPIEVNQAEAQYSFEGIEGEMEGNVLKARSKGKATVTANYNGLTASIDIKVLDEVKSFTPSIDKFNITTNSQRNLGSLSGIDKNGFKAKIYPEDVEWTVTNDIGYVKNGVFYSGEKLGSGAVTGRIGQGVNNILISVGGSGVSVEGFEDANNFKFSSYPEYVSGSVGISPEAKQGNNSAVIKYDFSQGDGTRAAYLDLTPAGNKGLTLNGEPIRLGLWVKGDGQGSWLRGIVKDANNKEYYIDFAKTLDSTDWQYVEANIPNVKYPITLDKIYVVETNPDKKHSGEVLIDGLTAIYPPKYDSSNLPKPTSFSDDRNTKSEKTPEGFSIMVAKSQPDIDKVAGFNASNTIRNRANNHDVNIFMGGASTEFIKSIQSKLVLNTGINYTKRDYRNVLFIDANSSKGSIRLTNPDQWIWLKNDLATTDKDHIVLILNTPIFGQNGFKDPLEAQLLHDILVETGETGKSIWVVHGGNGTNVKVEDGIRYIEYNNKPSNNPNEVKNMKAIEFVVNGKDMTYQVNPMFGK
ncbi:uncharacterized protein DUF2233 [Keratinibaculum paraultunense]|uniref:Uncharacterized protein DUF2233 n=1 Tax=Keratinibaculum paraultunense TaxID=1278232 RepID=A0A4R3KTF7_9FIRM|nr:phosphodiester glycosidase family protein [Keratinibaculum paraultunense]QQY79164.1 phosphodiester glycosidase family protein [Keratinibaculum paraultunense]TCS88548.1 uncharacterized protein DUF2233 [Keratinibaculum paraultunense]